VGDEGEGGRWRKAAVYDMAESRSWEPDVTSWQCKVCGYGSWH
jgi:hypothetical protein